MEFGTFSETTESLIAAAAEAKCPVSARNIADWHRAGLLPRPEVEHRGKPQGNLCHYPADARPRLLALLTYRTGGKLRPVPEMLWRLFAAGYQIEEHHLRRHFVRLAGQLDDFVRIATQLTRDDADGIDGGRARLADIAGKFARDRAWQARLGPFFPRAHAAQVIELLGGERRAGEELLNAIAPAFGETGASETQASEFFGLIGWLGCGSIQAVAAEVDYADLQQVTTDLARQGQRIAAVFARPVIHRMLGLSREACTVIEHVFCELSHPLSVLLVLVERRYAPTPFLGPTFRQLAELVTEGTA